MDMSEFLFKYSEGSFKQGVTKVIRENLLTGEAISPEDVFGKLLLVERWNGPK